MIQFSEQNVMRWRLPITDSKPLIFKVQHEDFGRKNRRASINSCWQKSSKLKFLDS